MTATAARHQSLADVEQATRRADERLSTLLDEVVGRALRTPATPVGTKRVAGGDYMVGDYLKYEEQE